MSLSEKSGQGPRVEVQGLFHSNSVPHITFLIRFWIFPLKKDWLVSIRLSPLFLVNLHKNTLTNLGWLVHDILPTSINWDAIHLYSRDEWFWLFMMPLPRVHICVSRDFWQILRFSAALIIFEINDVQFPANFYVSDSLSEHVCSNAGVSSITMLLVYCFILKAGLRKNWITLHFPHLFISNFYREI